MKRRSGLARSMGDADFWAAALVGLAQRRSEILEKMAELRRQIGVRADAGAASKDGAAPARTRRRMSAAGRKRIAAAQRKRWAALKKTQQAPVKKKRKLSVEGKRRIIAATKKRWAEFRKKKKAA
jgi:hypothetical protein